MLIHVNNYMYSFIIYVWAGSKPMREDVADVTHSIVG